MHRSGMRRPSNKCKNAVSRRLLPPDGRLRTCCILALTVTVLFPEPFTSGWTRVQTVTVRCCGEALAEQMADAVQEPKSKSNYAAL